MKKETLYLAGQLARAARVVCGGYNPFTGFSQSMSSIDSISEDIRRLKEVLDAYDNAVINETLKDRSWEKAK